LTTPTPSEPGRQALAFHVYLGAHSLLIGLLPFYLPVWLWRHGLDLAGLSLLIGVSGLSFAAALTPWQRLATRRSRRQLVQLTLLLEVVLIALVYAIGERGTAAAPLPVALLLGVANGAYSAFFWTTQRVLFAATLGIGDAGRRYGNFQIFVTVLLKVGIVIGGLVLEAGGLGWLLLVSILVAVLSGWQLSRLLPDRPLVASPPATASTSAPGDVRTRLVFLVDGVFLLLESHYWTLSLFLVFGQDFARLGVLVVVLGLAFVLLFWLAKNLIDRVPASPFYLLAVGLYALSWALRALSDDVGAGDPGGVATDQQGDAALLVLLVVITFCSTLFRLTFSKRFFEHAVQLGAVPYLVWKSRLSQTALGAAFLGVAMALTLGPSPVLHALDATYAFAALLALAYLLFPPPPRRATAHLDRRC